jgi:hypothetical protein
VRGVALEGLGHLQRELARRHQHEHLRLVQRQDRLRVSAGSANAAVFPVPVCA